ncbi:enolase C-terminal domain-like protein [Streptomyces sp. B-S-A8]|uniref:Enolase C-terminal domain-like protein n=1 Tax=Streptomyces solicavernae TaxID=3043614 RepID=A0ABT6RKV6_9ACTN|nr:enolase C-terminal domain-like protein [Streptomyces sp. B-S-A8]MDI3385064.1 enolase C-terminal domain-like protein [Streptomyces sp. B-S-A8]
MKSTLRTVRLQLTEPLRISRSTMAARDAVWLTVEHDGQRGHGEAVSSVYYGLDAPELERQLHACGRWLTGFPDPETALDALRDEPGRPGAAPGAARSSGPGAAPGAARSSGPGAAPGVMAAVESALLDLAGRRAGLPVHRLLGSAAARPSAATARTIGITRPDRAAAQAAALVRAGFSVLKVKAGTPDPADDLARVRAVRAAAPGARLLLDPNGAWGFATARHLLPQYADLGVEAVEQPVPPGTPDELARLAEASPLPVIADEDAADLADAARLAGRVHGINVKLAKCGGAGAALRIAELVEGTGTALMLGCLTASTLGIAPAVHLVDRARWVDLDGHLLLADDPWTGIGGADGTVTAPAGSGLGVRLRAAGAEA